VIPNGGGLRPPLTREQAAEVVRRATAYPTLRAATLREAAEMLRGTAGVIEDGLDGEVVHDGPHSEAVRNYTHAAETLERLASSTTVPSSAPPPPATPEDTAGELARLRRLEARVEALSGALSRLVGAASTVQHAEPGDQPWSLLAIATTEAEDLLALDTEVDHG
jgi:hypothetical protein